MAKLTIRISNSAAVQIHRDANKANRLVYVAMANKKMKYPHGQSKIGYIGTTKVGADRIAASAAAKSKELLSVHGVKTLSFFVVTCTGKQKVDSWRKLERGLLLVFRETYGLVPRSNSHGKSMKWTDELKYFTRDRLKTVIDKY